MVEAKRKTTSEPAVAAETIKGNEIQPNNAAPINVSSDATGNDKPTATT